MVRRGLRIVVLFVAVFFAATASAQSRQDRARDLFERGRALYAERKYDEALESLMQAYVLDPSPVLIYNIARIHEDKDDLENAARFFENYLKIAPRAKDRAAVKKRLAALKKAIATRPPRGFLTLSTTPPGATIRVDGLVVGQSPVSAVPLSAGRHGLEANIDGYETWRMDVAITGGRTLTLSANLSDRPGPVIIETNPPGAEVFVLGGSRQSLGRCPCSAMLAAGKHTLEASALGFKPTVVEVEKLPSQPLTLRITLVAEATTGELEVTSTVAGSVVTVDGHSVGTPPFASPLLLRAGVVRVEVSAPGHEPYVETVSISPGRRASVMARLVPQGSQQTNVVVAMDTPRSGMRVAGFAVLGIGITGAVAGAALHATAKAREYDYTHNGVYRRVATDVGPVLLSMDTTRAKALEAEELSKNLELGAIISYAVGGAMILTGAILVAVDPSQDLERLSFPLPGLIPVEGGGLATLGWSF